MTRKLKKRDYHVAFIFKVVVFVAVLLTLIALLGGCFHIKDPAPPPAVVESHKPVLVQPQAPEIIIQRWQPEAIPEWVSPSDPEASSCLKKEGEDQQRRNMQKEQRIRKTARAWAGVI